MTNLTNMQRDSQFADPSTVRTGGASSSLGNFQVRIDGIVYNSVGHLYMEPYIVALGANEARSIGVAMAPTDQYNVPYRVQMRTSGKGIGAVSYVQAADIVDGNIAVPLGDYVVLGDASGQGIDQMIILNKPGDFIPLFFCAMTEQPASPLGGFVSVQRCIDQPPQFASAVS